MENPFRWNNRALLQQFAKACAQAGFSNSGMVISFSGGYDARWANYLQSVVLARIEKENPPFQPGEQVSPKGQTVEAIGSYIIRGIPSVLTVEEVHYQGDGPWLLVFKERNEPTCKIDSTMYEDGVEKIYTPFFFKAVDFKSIPTVAEVK